MRINILSQCHREISHHSFLVHVQMRSIAHALTISEHVQNVRLGVSGN